MTAPTIWTIGYEQATLDAVIGALKGAGVEVLADVRALPLSRRPGFSKTALAGALAQAGIQYVHFKALGTPADGRAAARHQQGLLRAGTGGAGHCGGRLAMDLNTGEPRP